MARILILVAAIWLILRRDDRRRRRAVPRTAEIASFVGHLEKGHGDDLNQGRPVYVDRLRTEAGDVYYLDDGHEVYYLDLGDPQNLPVSAGTQIRVRGLLSDNSILVARTADGRPDVNALSSE